MSLTDTEIVTLIINSIFSSSALIVAIAVFNHTRQMAKRQAKQDINKSINDINNIIVSSEEMLSANHELFGFADGGCQEKRKRHLAFMWLNLIENFYTYYRHGLIDYSYFEVIVRGVLDPLLKHDYIRELINGENGYTRDFVNYCGERTHNVHLVNGG